MRSDTLRTVRRVGSLAALCGAVALVAVACDQYRETQLVRSVPVGLMQPNSPKALESAIEGALAKHGWAVKAGGARIPVRTRFSGGGDRPDRAVDDPVPPVAPPSPPPAGRRAGGGLPALAAARLRAAVRLHAAVHADPVQPAPGRHVPAG